MIVTKEHQEALLNEYIKKGHNIDRCQGFIDGYLKACELITKTYKIEKK